jgi:hypothetical protein
MVVRLLGLRRTSLPRPEVPAAATAAAPATMFRFERRKLSVSLALWSSLPFATLRLAFSSAS